MLGGLEMNVKDIFDIVAIVSFLFIIGIGIWYYLSYGLLISGVSLSRTITAIALIILGSITIGSGVYEYGRECMHYHTDDRVRSVGSRVTLKLYLSMLSGIVMITAVLLAVSQWLLMSLPH
jgi:hypothetical protein